MCSTRHGSAMTLGQVVVMVAFVGGSCATPLRGQSRADTQPDPIPAEQYRAPSIALVQPRTGGTISQDRAAIVLRFVQGEPDDAVDLMSFAVSVDGADRSAAFQVTGDANGHQAWGTLEGPLAGSRPGIGAHEIVARVCSTRGACAVMRASVEVTPAIISPARGSESARRSRRILGALLEFARMLLQLW